MSDEKLEDLGCLPTGAHLYRNRNSAGGWTYYSDECGCMSTVWDTCITNESTVLAAILCEHHRKQMERRINLGWKPTKAMVMENMAAAGGSFLGPIENGSMDSPFVEGSDTMSLDHTTPESGIMPNGYA